MSKVIRISDEKYALIESMAFNNGVEIQHLAEKVLEIGIAESKKMDCLIVEERGRNVKIRW